MHRVPSALALLISVSAAPLWGQDRSVAVTNVTVIDATGAPPKANMTVLVRDGRIAEIGPALNVPVPKGVRSLDGRGKYLIPGLWDMHVHLDHGGPESLGLFVANGVTGVREMGGDFGLLLDWRRQIEAGTLVGPRVKLAGPILESPRFLQMIARFEKEVGTPAGESIIPERIAVGSPGEAARAVDSIARLGADFVKIRTVANPATYFAILREARRVGLPVVGHTPYGMDPATVADSGQRSMEHGFFPPLALDEAGRKALFDRFVGKGLWVDPTLVAGKYFRDTPDSLVYAILDDSLGRLEPRLRYASKKQIAAWRRDIDMKKGESPTDWDAVRRGNAEAAAEMHSAGVRLLAGTDSPTVLIFPGFALHQELELLVKTAGLSPLEAIQAATRNPAEFFGLGDSAGTIEKGKTADLVLLGANPLENISNTQQIQAVILGGKLYSRTELTALLERAATAAPR